MWDTEHLSLVFCCTRPTETTEKVFENEVILDSTPDFNGLFEI